MCRIEEYAEGVECVEVVDWRADVNDAGICASVDEVKALIDRAPTCLVTHGSLEDYTRYGLLTLTCRAGVPLVDLVMT